MWGNLRVNIASKNVSAVDIPPNYLLCAVPCGERPAEPPSRAIIDMQLHAEWNVALIVSKQTQRMHLIAETAPNVL
jgi:hypothetical protein